MVKISVIIPIYNVEKYLRHCIDSVLSQSLKEIEVICINDESPDNCLPILKEYSKKDNRIKIINKKNEGQGVARNEGLKIATGEYVLFLDSDDSLEPYALSKLYNKIKSDNSEILFFNVNYINEETNTIKYKRNYIKPYFNKFCENVFSPLDAKNILFMTSAHPFKMYKKDSLLKYKFHYTNHRHWEDYLPYFEIMTNVDKISCINEVLYNYLDRKFSSTKMSSRCLNDCKSCFYECENAIFQTRFGKQFINEFLEYEISHFKYYLQFMKGNNFIKYYNDIHEIANYIDKKYGNKFVEKSRCKFFYEAIKRYNFIEYVFYKINRRLLLLILTYFK